MANGKNILAKSVTVDHKSDTPKGSSIYCRKRNRGSSIMAAKSCRLRTSAAASVARSASGSRTSTHQAWPWAAVSATPSRIRTKLIGHAFGWMLNWAWYHLHLRTVTRDLNDAVSACKLRRIKSYCWRVTVSGSARADYSIGVLVEPISRQHCFPVLREGRSRGCRQRLGVCGIGSVEEA